MEDDNLVILADLHLAEIWDKIDKIIPDKYHFLNSNKLFEQIVSSISKNQKLIINGDLIDYHYTDRNLGSHYRLKVRVG